MKMDKKRQEEPAEFCRLFLTLKQVTEKEQKYYKINKYKHYMINYVMVA